MKTPNPWLALLALAAIAFLHTDSALAEKRQPDATLTGHSGTALDLAFSPDGKRLASAGDDGKLKIWDVNAKKELFSFDGLRSNTNRVRFTPDGGTVVAIGSSNNVLVFDAATGKPPRSIALSSQAGGASSLDLSPDGKWIAVSGRGGIRLLNLATGAVKGEFQVHSAHDVPDVAFSADGARIATVGTDNTAALLETATGRIIRTFNLGLNGVAVSLSRDGKTLFAASTDRAVQSFNVETGAAKKLVEKGVPIFSLAVSKDGKTLVLGGPARSPWLVTLPDGALLESELDSDAWVKSAAISPDGKMLAGGGNGGDVYLWKNGQ